MRTLNGTETVARGCALMSAMMSPLFKVADYGMEEYNLYPIRCSWKFVQNMEIEGDKKEESSVIFPVGCNIPSIKSLAFAQKQGPIKLDVFYDKPL